MTTNQPNGDLPDEPALGPFLGLLDREIDAGRVLDELPDDLAQRMLEDAKLDIDLDEPIEGDVDL